MKYRTAMLTALLAVLLSASVVGCDRESKISDETTVPPLTAAPSETAAAPGTIAWPESTAAPTTTAVPSETTAPPETTAVPITTASPETTAVPVTIAPPETTAVPATTAPPETTAAPETTADPVLAKPAMPTVAGDYAVRTLTLPGVGTNYRELVLDARYRLFITYDTVEGSRAVRNQELHLFDIEAGRFTASCAVSETHLLDRLLHDGGTTYLYAQSGQPGEAYRPVAAVTLDYGLGKLNLLSAIPAQVKPLWLTLISPDGRYTVTEDYLGDVYVISPTTGEQRLLDRLNLNDILPNGQTVGLSEVIGYQPLTFIDNTRLLVGMSGYEWSRGFLLIDVETGQITNFPDCAGYTLLGYADGAIYAAQPGEAAFSTAAFWRITPDGQKTRIYAFTAEEQQTHELTLESRFFTDGWLLAERKPLESPTYFLAAWSRDFSVLLATLEMDARTYANCTPIVTDDTLYLISRDLPDSPEPPVLAEHSFDLQFTYRGDVLYDDRTFHATIDLPTSWMAEEYFPLELYEDGRTRIILHNSLYFEDFDEFRAGLAASPAGKWDLDHPITGTTDSGIPYVGYLLLSTSVPDDTPNDWYLLSFDVGEGYSYRLGVDVYPEDDADYFERVLRPVIESLTVTLGEPVRPYGTEIFTHRIFSSATTLRFYIDEADPRYFAVRCANTMAGRDYTLDLSIPEGLTYDSARPIYAGGGGGSGECEFIVEFRQGEQVTYVSYNNFTYTDHTDWLNFTAKVVDAAYVNDLRQTMPYLFH